MPEIDYNPKGRLGFLSRCLFLRVVVALAFATAPLSAQQPDTDSIADLKRRLAESERRLAESERRIQALELKLGIVAEAPAAPAPVPVPSTPVPVNPVPSIPVTQDASDAQMQGHNMALPHGGPTLNIRGFFDFNFGTGSLANPLIFPASLNGCDVCGNASNPPHSGFQAGEFDLFMSSKLSNRISFLAETVLGADNSNVFSVDIERYQLTYTHNDYFSVSAGRFHTAIGYYNTAYHHGNWFSTAEGRPIMYLFEDSGGILPVHTVGVTTGGLVPGTGSLGLHWIAEMGNGRSSNKSALEPVENFYTDRSYKATNFAAYIRPDWLQGLQIGGSWYHDRLDPSGLPKVSQNIESAYVIYHSAAWEFLNEGVLLSNKMIGSAGVTHRSPMAYSQLSRAFGIYRPYFRFQYVNDVTADPVNVLHGLYYGPSVGVRVDFTAYAAFKLQYNRLLRGELAAQNGLNAQVAFTF